MESLEPDIGDESDADLIDRIHKAADTLELLFAAWARYELEEVRQQDRLFGDAAGMGKDGALFSDRTGKRMTWRLCFPAMQFLSLCRMRPAGSSSSAPYIKSATIRRLLKTIPDTVSECVCITRWLPEDIVSGVCDLEIFDDVTQAKGGRLLGPSALAREILFEWSRRLS